MSDQSGLLQQFTMGGLLGHLSRIDMTARGQPSVKSSNVDQENLGAVRRGKNSAGRQMPTHMASVINILATRDRAGEAGQGRGLRWIVVQPVFDQRGYVRQCIKVMDQSSAQRLPRRLRGSG